MSFEQINTYKIGFNKDNPKLDFKLDMSFDHSKNINITLRTYYEILIQEINKNMFIEFIIILKYVNNNVEVHGIKTDYTLVDREPTKEQIEAENKSYEIDNIVNDLLTQINDLKNKIQNTKEPIQEVVQATVPEPVQVPVQENVPEPVNEEGNFAITNNIINNLALKINTLKEKTDVYPIAEDLHEEINNIKVEDIKTPIDVSQPNFSSIEDEFKKHIQLQEEKIQKQIQDFESKLNIQSLIINMLQDNKIIPAFTPVPPTEAPPTEAPPTEAPPTEVLPTEEPPIEEAPPTEASNKDDIIIEIENKLFNHLGFLLSNDGISIMNNIVHVVTELMKFIDNFFIKGGDKKEIILTTLKKYLISENYDEQSINLIIDVVCPELIDILVSVDKRKIMIKKRLSCIFPWCS